MGTEQDEEYIEEPDEMDDNPETNGLVCFMNIDRPCGADCMAYAQEDSESKYLSDQQKGCTVLVSIERLGRYAGGIMKTIKDSQADTARARQVAPATHPAGKS
jgi:hypothetical protein